MEITIDLIREGDNNLRNVNVEAVEFKNLMDSIAKHGLLNPISVTPYSEADDPEKPEEITFEGYRIVDGLHRLYACRKLGKSEIEVNVVNVESDDDLNMLQIQGNLQRIETRPHEYAAKLREMQVLRPTTTLAEFAVELSTTESFLKQRLKLLKLVDHAAQLVDEGEIGVSNATQLAQLPPEEQADWVESARTADSQTFAGDIAQRLKDIRQERIASRDSGSTEFTPKARFRGIGEAMSEIDAPSHVSNLLSAQGISDPLEAAKEALRWVLRLDSESVSAAKEEYEAKARKRAEDRERKKAGSLQKKKEEYQKKLAELEAAEADA